MKLEDITPRKTPFTLPEGYFDNLPERLFARIQSSSAPTKTRPIASPPLKRIWSYAASIVLLFATCGLLYYNDLSSIEHPYTYAEEYSNDYFDQLYETLSIDDYTLYTYLTSNNTDF